MAEKDGKEKEDLGYAGGDPGAVRHGNFINYYAFHPASERISHLPIDVWTVGNDYGNALACLDIGCNSGELTLELHSLVSHCLHREGGGDAPVVRTLGVDLDPMLVERAQQCNSQPANVEFACTNITDETSSVILDDFLARTSVSKFGCLFLMSVTMWVHLVSGDEALRTLLERCASLTDRWLVLEPQPWSCYRSAQRRLVKSGAPGFPLYPSLAIKGPQLHSFMHELLTQECGMVKVHETKPTKWGRTTIIYQKTS